MSFIFQYRKHGEKPTKLELFQFTAATLFFCNAVVSNRTAQNIIEDAQANTINDYRNTLRSNRHRYVQYFKSTVAVLFFSNAGDLEVFDSSIINLMPIRH